MVTQDVKINRYVEAFPRLDSPLFFPMKSRSFWPFVLALGFAIINSVLAASFAPLLTGLVLAFSLPGSVNLDGAAGRVRHGLSVYGLVFSAAFFSGLAACWA